jgi:hypothetical protein
VLNVTKKSAAKTMKTERDDFGNRFERLFSELCSKTFLSGFVFHSPKVYKPTEEEAGDVLLWIRRFVVDFELISQNHEKSDSARQFVKRIGHKRKQLIRDSEVFRNPETEIHLTNELGQSVVFDKKAIGYFLFQGIVLVDCNIEMQNLHFETVRQAVEADFPLAIMPIRGFYDLLAEVDTIPDLVYYLNDRCVFLKEVFRKDPRPFLNLSLRTERNLIAFYKLNQNRFDLEEWNSDEADAYPRILRERWSDGIARRDEENRTSLVVDRIADFIRKASPDGELAKLHGWELSMLSRRQRAIGMGGKIETALIGLRDGRKMRFFANYNQATGCWLVFYFRYGNAFERFVDECEVIVRYKLVVEIADRSFEHSVFLYGFWKRDQREVVSFDHMYLTVADAGDDVSPIPSQFLDDARALFDGGQEQEISEFPSSSKD